MHARCAVASQVSLHCADGNAAGFVALTAALILFGPHFVTPTEPDGNHEFSWAQLCYKFYCCGPCSCYKLWCGNGDEEKAQLKEGLKRVYCGRREWHWLLFILSIAATYFCSQLTHGFIGVTAVAQFCQQDNNQQQPQQQSAKCIEAQKCGDVLYETVFPDAASFDGPLIVTWIGHAMMVLDKIFEHFSGGFKKTAIQDAGGDAPLAERMVR